MERGLAQILRWELLHTPADQTPVQAAVTIIRPEALVRWHRAGFRRYWRWKSRALGGRPQIDAELRH
jgi:hypothetical protein